MSKNDNPKEHDEIVEDQIKMGFRDYERSNLGLSLSAFTAGLEVGFSVMLMGILHYMFNGKVDPEILHLIIAAGYPLGFVFVIIGRSELFTEQTALAILPVLNGKASIKELLRLWGFVILGNLIGGLLFALFISWIGTESGRIPKESFVHIAKVLVEPGWQITLGSAILAGWMMGLLGWLISSVRESISHIVIVIFITLIIGIGGLHHSIVGNIEVLSGLLVSDSITFSDYFSFLIFAVVGNVIGGAFFVSVLKYTQMKAGDKGRA